MQNHTNNHSQILTCAALAVVSALVVVQASQYGANGARPHGSQYGQALSTYPSAGCQGYNCNKQAARSPYGPYHSYAVRPVVYGGYGLYNYKGYARHPPAPAYQRKQRYPRSYGMAPPRRRRPAAGAYCRGRYCATPPRHYAPQASRPYKRPQQQYQRPQQQQYQRPQQQYQRPQQQQYQQMRSVKALALAPVSNYQAGPSYQQQQQGGYRQAAPAAAASYGSGRAAAHGSGHYGPANNYAQQQRYHRAGQKATNNGY